MREPDRVFAGASRRDLGLERLGQFVHRVEPDVLLPPREVQRVAAAEHHRGDAVAHALLAIWNVGMDRGAHLLQPIRDLGREGGDVLVDGLR